jgi:hypothetical protein
LIEIANPAFPAGSYCARIYVAQQDEQGEI